MVNRDLIRIKHMRDSCEALLSFVLDKNRAHLDQDRLLISGVIRELEILGEAAGAVTMQTKNLFPTIPWKLLHGMRNRLIHAYFDVNNDIIWKTVNSDIPLLLVQIKKTILTLENPS